MSATERRSSEPFAAQGAWWSPANPGTQLAGTFEWSPGEGGKLSLIGFFGEDGADPSNWSSPVLHGVADRDEYTLLNCHANAFSINVPGVPTQGIKPFGGTVVGVHLSDGGAPGFDRLEVEIDFLAQLSSRQSIETRVHSNDGHSIDVVEVVYEQPRDVVAVVQDGTVRLRSRFASGRSVAGGSELHETVSLVFEVNQPVPLADLVDRYLSRARDLVTFAAQRPASIRAVRVGGPVTAETLPSGRQFKRPVQLLAPFLPVPSPTPPTTLTRQLLRIPADDRSFRVLIRSWLDIGERLGPVLDLRFAASYAGFVYGETRFLNAAHAVEALHRRILAGKPDPADVDARAAAIAGCPTSHRKWLEGKLAYSHEPTLRKRLRETIDYVGVGLRPLVARPGQFVNSVVRARNSLTHWDAKAAKRPGADLYRLSVILGYVVDGALLRCLHHSEDEVADVLQANEHFRWASSQYGM